MFDEIAGMDAAAGGEAGGGGDGGTGAAVAEPPPAEGGEPAASGEEAPSGDAADPDPSIEPGIEKPAHEQAKEEELPELAGKNVDEKTRKAISELKKLNPEAAKAAADAYFANQAVLKETGAKSVGEAISAIRQAKATIESLGGEEGIQTLQTENAQFRKEMDQFAAGDKELINELMKESVEKTVGMAINAFEVIRESDSKAFDAAIVPFINDRIRAAELPQSVDTLLKFIEEGKGQEAYDLTQKIKQWANGVDTMARKQGDARKAATIKSPEAQRLDARERELNQEKAQLYDGQVGAAVNGLNNTAMSKTVEPFLRDLKLPIEGRREFVGGLQSKIYAAMKADKGFQRLAAALKAKGDVQRTAQFVADKFAELLPGMFEKHRNAMYPNYRAKAATPGAKPAATNGTKPAAAAAAAVTTTGGQPKYEEVDWTKTSDVEWIAGHAVLKNGTRRDFKFV